MGHVINTQIYEAKNEKEALQKGLSFAEEFARENVSRQENPFGNYHGHFKLYDRTFETEEEAEDFFSSLGSYRDGVVKIKVRTPDRKKHAEHLTKMLKHEKRKEEIFKKALSDFAGRKSGTVECRICKTRITKEIALSRKLVCPVCRNLLVPDGVKVRMAECDKRKKRNGKGL